MGKNSDTSDDNNSKSAPAAAVVAEPAVASEPERETLDEFCIRLSKVDKRVELIGAFHATERAARRVKDTAAAYRARFEAFVNKPV